MFFSCFFHVFFNVFLMFFFMIFFHVFYLFFRKKLIKKFPLDLFLIEFPKVVTNVANSLKSRALEVRDNARKALVEIIKILGPNFLYNIIKEMTNVLLLGNFPYESLLKIRKKQGIRDMC